MFMDTFEIIEKIRSRPVMYLMDAKSLKHVCSFLIGYQCGRAGTSEKIEDRQFIQFHDWLSKRLGFEGTAMSWHTVILKKAGSDEKAYEMFFELLDEFKGQKGATQVRINKGT
jgi:hypothetical protein